jgi:hypothetical protein
MINTTNVPAHSGCWARQLICRVLPIALLGVLPLHSQQSSDIDLARSSRTKIDSVRLEVNRHGFWPPSVTVRPGKFFLVLDSATDLPDIAIALRERGKASTLLNQPMRKQRIDGSRTLLTLGVGTYVLRSPSFPETEATIVVTAETPKQ